MKKIKILNFFLLVVFIMTVAACHVNSQEKGCVVDAKDVKKAETSDEDFILLDVRSQEEFKAGHLQGAKLINVNDSNFSQEIDKLDKERQYYVYCRSGKRSTKAQEMMLGKGFKKVCNIKGGILKMQSENMKLIRGEN